MSDIGDALDALIDDTRDKDQEIHVQDFTREMLYREQITAMGIEVTTEVGKLAGVRFTHYKDAIEWLTAHNALLDSFRGLCADINHERVSERKVPQ